MLFQGGALPSLGGQDTTRTTGRLELLNEVTDRFPVSHSILAYRLASEYAPGRSEFHSPNKLNPSMAGPHPAGLAPSLQFMEGIRVFVVRHWRRHGPRGVRWESLLTGLLAPISCEKASGVKEAEIVKHK